MNFTDYFLDCRVCINYNTLEDRCSIDDVDEAITDYFLNEGWDYADASKADCPFWIPDEVKVNKLYQ